MTCNLAILFLKDMTVSAAQLAGLIPTTALATATTKACNYSEFLELTPEEYIASVVHRF